VSDKVAKKEEGKVDEGGKVGRQDTLGSRGSGASSKANENAINFSQPDRFWD